MYRKLEFPAVLAPSEAGVLDIEQAQVIDANTRVTCRQPPDRLEPAADTPPNTPSPPASGGVMANLPASVETLLARSDVPVVTIVAGDDRRDALRVPHLHKAKNQTPDSPNGRREDGTQISCCRARRS